MRPRMRVWLRVWLRAQLRAWLKPAVPSGGSIGVTRSVTSTQTRHCNRDMYRYMYTPPPPVTVTHAHANTDTCCRLCLTPPCLNAMLDSPGHGRSSPTCGAVHTWLCGTCMHAQCLRFAAQICVAHMHGCSAQCQAARGCSHSCFPSPMGSDLQGHRDLGCPWHTQEHPSLWHPLAPDSSGLLQVHPAAAHHCRHQSPGTRSPIPL